MDAFFKHFKNRFQKGGEKKPDDVIDKATDFIKKGIEKVRDPKGKCKGKIWYSPTPPYKPDPCWRQDVPGGMKKKEKTKKYGGSRK